MDSEIVSVKKKNFVEALIVFSVMTGILLPVRLFFVTYVSTEWYGSFGIISAISALMIILTKKGKLGRFGQMFERQINKLQKGKRAKIIYGQSIVFLLILGGTIFAIEQGNSVYADLKNQLLEEHKEFSEPEQILKKVDEMQAQDWLYGIIGMFLAIFFAFPQLSAVLAVLNDSLDGWVLHFYTVAFVEYLELFGILLYFRFSLSKKNTTKSSINNVSKN
ncbi:MAG TPA: hypothetical protein VH562_06800 [Nitrosopumilaceae archaeon]